MKTELEQRLERIRLAILRTRDKSRADVGHDRPVEKIDGLLVNNIVNVGYLSGFTGSSAVALIMPDHAYLITDSRYDIQAREQCPHFEVVVSRLSTGAMDLLTEALSRYKRKIRIGFETTASFAQVQLWKTKTGDDVRWRPTTDMIESLRSVKDLGEIDTIRAAVRVAEKAFADAAPLLAPGNTERQYALELDTAMRRHGADRVAFDTIVASGPNGALPHYTPGDRIFAAGDLVTIDWGAEYKGYCSDLTRTVLISGAPATSQQQEVYAIVREAKERATAQIRPGVTGREIDSIARDFIAEHGYGEYFGHSLGHAIGRVVHDGPALSPRSDDIVLKPGMVITVEPGIYIEGWGGVRIEDDVLVTQAGHEVLSATAGALEATASAKPKKTRAKAEEPPLD